MANRKPKPVEIKPISLNPNAAHKPEDEGEDGSYTADQPVEVTLEEARAEEATNESSGEESSDDAGGPDTPARIKLKWTDAMKAATIHAIYDYHESAGSPPSILDLFEILQGDEAFSHLSGQFNHKNAPLFSPLSLQAGVNAIRKSVAKDIASGDTELAPLPSLARVQVERTKRVTDTRALGLLIAQREAKLREVREAAAAAGTGD